MKVNLMQENIDAIRATYNAEVPHPPSPDVERLWQQYRQSFEHGCHQPCLLNWFNALNDFERWRAAFVVEDTV